MTLLLEKLNSSGTLTKVKINGIYVYYSYSTPIALEIGDNKYATNKKYSVTTSKQITQIGFKDFKIDHEDFKKLLIDNKIID